MGTGQNEQQFLLLSLEFLEGSSLSSLLSFDRGWLGKSFLEGVTYGKQGVER